MNGNGQNRSQAGEIGIDMHAEWSTGPRTPAWEKLWKAILGNLEPEPAAIGQQLGREGDDG